MSRTEKLTSIALKDFSGGLNLKGEPYDIAPNEVQDCLNVLFDEKPGLIVKRKGKVFISTVTGDVAVVRSYNFISSSGTNYIIVQLSNYKCYSSPDMVNWTEIVPTRQAGTTVTFTAYCTFTTFENMLWITNGADDVCLYDGTHTAWVLDGATYTSGNFPTGKSNPWVTPDVPKGKYALLNLDRIYLVNTTDNSSEVRFSRYYNDAGTDIYAYDENAWPATNQVSAGQDDGTKLFGGAVYRGNIVLFKKNAIYVLRGTSPSYFQLDKVSSEIGCIWHWTIREYDNLLIFLGNDGLYSFDGNSVLKLSYKIQPFFDTCQNILSDQMSWIFSNTAHWDTGTFGDKIVNTASDELKLLPQTTQTDWNAGTKTNLTAATANLSINTDSNDSDLAYGKTMVSSGFYTASNIANATDNDVDSFATLQTGTSTWNVLYVDLLTAQKVSTISIYIKNNMNQGDDIAYYIVGSNDAENWTTLKQLNSPYINTTVRWYKSYGGDTAYRYYGIRLWVVASKRTTVYNHYVYEFRVMQSVFVSQTLDYGQTTPDWLNLLANQTVPAGASIVYYTQTSTDGNTWDDFVLIGSAGEQGGAVNSSQKRYIRWKAILYNNSALDSVAIIAVYIGAIFWRSPVKNIGYVPTQWGKLEVDYALNSQTCTFWMRGGTSEANCLSASWTQITANTAPTITLRQYIQVEIRQNSNLYSQLAVVYGLIVNYYKSGLNIQDAQSFVFERRYYLTCVSQNNTYADTVIPMSLIPSESGKKVVFSYFTGLNIASFLQHGRDLYAGSATDGDFFQLFSGYNDAGVAISCNALSKDLDFGVPDRQKRIRYAWLTAEQPGNHQLTFAWSFDDGSEYDISVNLVAGTGTYNRRHSFAAGTRGKFLRIKVENNVIDQQLEFKGVDIYAVALPLRHLTSTVDGGGGLVPRTWTTATRPSNPYAGQQGYNSDYSTIEVYIGSGLWLIENGKWTTDGRPATAKLSTGSFGTNTDLSISERFDGTQWVVD